MTEDFPYTIGYVMELLGIDERELMGIVHTLGLTPKKDDKTGRLIFTHRDIETLKKAREMKSHGDDMNTIVRHLAPHLAAASAASQTPPNASRPMTARPPQSGNRAPVGRSADDLPSYMTPSSSQRQPVSTHDNITVMVEAVSQVKEGILKDLSRLLDDKLSGLDEVVVELIRCKSENDSLKKKLDEAIRDKETIAHELTRFKPVQFGFYRKT